MPSINCTAPHRGDFISRRQLIQLGGVGMLGLGLPQFLNASAAGRSSSSGRARQKSCIFLVQYGGCSHIDSFDLKPDAPEGIRGPYKPIATSVPGMQIGELLPRLASQANRYCLVRSMSHGNGGHDGGMHVCMTGHSNPTPDTPYFGSVMAKLRPALRNIPSYVWIQNLAGDVQPRYLTGGFLGAPYSPLRVGQDLDNPSVPNFRMAAFDPATDVSHERLRERHGLLDVLEPTSAPLLQNVPQAGNLKRFQERAVDLITGPEARRAFDLSQESAKIRDRYGRHPLGQNALMARRLIEAGVRLVSVTAWTGVPPGQKFNNVQTWDMHGGGLGGIFGTGQHGLGWALPNVDQAVSALLEDLEQRGLLEDTLVVMVGEFGRSPTVGKGDGAGRDHWPHVYSALLAGGGIRGGVVYGASDNRGGYVKDKPVSPEAFGATLFHALGVPPETRLGADGFTRPASAGQPILDLFG
jgi:hypothetical protein